MAATSEKRMFPQREQDNDSAFKSMKSDTGITTDDDFKASENRRIYEMGENVPLKRSHNQQGVFGSGDFGLKMIILAFFVVTFAITIALIVQIFGESTYPVRSSGTIVSDNEECSKIGIALLKKGGSAVDAVIGTQLCLSVIHPHLTGIGGGGFMLIHNQGKQKKTVALDFREAAPADISKSFDINKTVTTVGVPGLLHGLQTAHEMYGKLKWDELVRPAAEIARNGFKISPYLAESLEQELPRLEDIRLALFPNISLTADISTQKVRLEKLADALDMISQHGADVLYKGKLGTVLVKTLLNLGGLLEMSDFENYSTIVSEPLNLHWKDLSIVTMGRPSSGPPLLLALQALENVTLANNSSMIEFVLPLLKASESAAAERKIVLNLTEGSQKSSNETAGISTPFSQLKEDRASNIVAVDENELFVTLISGLGTSFGSRVVIEGILMNDALLHFATQSPDQREIVNNSLGRPPSTMTPAIVYDTRKTCGIRLATGAASSQLLLEVLIQKLTANKSAEAAIEAARFDVSFSDKRIFEEQKHRPALDKDVEESLTIAGYTATSILPPYISVNMIAKHGDSMESHADSRGGGFTSLV